jgi:hypothetical protein
MPGIFTITTPAPSVELATLANVKEELNVSDSGDDAYLSRLITRASRLIANHCGRVFGYQAISETFRYGWQPGIGPTSQQVAPYGTPLNVQYKPLILSFNPVVPGSDQITENGTLLVNGTDYELDGDSGLAYRLRNGLRSWWGVPTIVAVYQAGYLLANDTAPAGPAPQPAALPDDLESICVALVAAGYQARGRDPTVYQEVVTGVGTVTYQRGTTGNQIALPNMHIDDATDSLLAPYRVRAW